ncbi:MAG: hypothetical protein ACXVAU_14395, partial [Mucilaginibacter sp.]
MSLAEILVQVSLYSAIFPLLAALFNYRQLENVLKIMAAFCLFSALIDFFSVVVLHWGVHNNQPFMHLYDAVAVIFFTVIYYLAFYETILKKIALILGGASMVTMICNAIFIEDLQTYPSVSNTVLCLLLIILSLIYFYQLLTRQEFIHIEKQGLFWVNAGVLFYFSINIFLFMLFNKINSDALKDFNMIQSVTNIIANLL